MNEQHYEKLLNIKTSGEEKSAYQSLHYSSYEPTPYSALDVLSEQYNFTAEDSVVDFGCGKGRLNFYINHFFNCTVTGVEMNPSFYKEALDNKNEYLRKYKNRYDKINFLDSYAEETKINSSDNIFYFFNPFSTHIFIDVVDNILNSVENNRRTVDIILYYPSEEYIYYLNDSTPFKLFSEIQIPYLYNKNSRESFVIYRLEA